MSTRLGTNTKTARLFVAGGSQAVRLPAEFRFEGTEVLIRRDPCSGDVVLSPVTRKSWASFVALRERMRAELRAEGLDDYLLERNQAAQGPRDPFEGWSEGRVEGEGTR
ncbi:AbrB/MazE/SpoVT family DNA-binding domain-containing protein [Vandammella animalimorsus]|uniref:AbrB/MazE/SpoVT family DNA-binding domain-containing protein n=1 Tax=Vandammella animalimorsus TaxID=2029117 RepID=A0A2A2AQ75_9BURK|nr:AbrB/MazE/SpoVT family DNA-binding domain-containing protein [Vandammella animalimorsus]PAT39779.1 AbrB/MazE/SpoVT family DNA-binding domain-containing protein [Vandammella animalimorsus]